MTNNNDRQPPDNPEDPLFLEDALLWVALNRGELEHDVFIESIRKLRWDLAEHRKLRVEAHERQVEAHEASMQRIDVLLRECVVQRDQAERKRRRPTTPPDETQRRIDETLREIRENSAETKKRLTEMQEELHAAQKIQDEMMRDRERPTDGGGGAP